MNESRYIEASVKGRLLYATILILSVVAYFFRDILDFLFPLPEDAFLHVEAVDFRNLLAVIFATCVIAPVVVYVIIVARTVRYHMEFPTPHMNLPARQRVRHIANPSYIWLAAAGLVVPLVFQMFLMWYSWYSWHKLLSEAGLTPT